MSKKQNIIVGLFSVMEQYEYSIITVTQIAQEAQIGRKTFYRYFKNKDEVLEEAIAILFDEYSSYQENYYSNNIEMLIYNHFSFWSKHLFFLKLLYKNELMFYIFKHYQQYISQLNYAYFINNKFNDTSSKYANAFTAGAFWSMLYTWIENDAIESPNEIAKLCSDLLINRVK